jgi:proteasome lid subunit RPN8/RPN11
VADCLVIGIDDERFGQAVTAVAALDVGAPWDFSEAEWGKGREPPARAAAGGKAAAGDDAAGGGDGGDGEPTHVLLVTGQEGGAKETTLSLAAGNETDRDAWVTLLRCASDPERFPRTSRTYFKIHELRAAKAFDRGRASGRPIKVIYHSHCDAGAYFSPEDAATFASGGTLMWPCAFLVVSVVEGVAAGHRLWVHTPGTDAFHEAVLEIRNPDDTRSDHAPR